MREQTIYLIGQISSVAIESYEWRRKVREYFDKLNVNVNHFNVIDPCHNAFNRSVQSDFTVREKVYETDGVDLIVPKDRMAVKESSICFANFHRYDLEKALIGTMFELAWYADSRDKAVIGIFNGDHMSDEYCRHPFVRNAVHVWVKNEIEACDLAVRYFMD